MEHLTVETLIIQNLISNDTFVRQSIPFFKEAYFEESHNALIFKIINNYYQQKNSLPQLNIALIELNDLTAPLADKQIAEEQLKNLYTHQQKINDLDWLLNQSEQWCKERSMYLNILTAISIYDGSEKKLTPHCIPDLMKEALAISFNQNIGLDWQDDSEKRFERYETQEDKIPFGLDIFNDITHGGLTTKSLSVMLGGVHVGKTMSLIHLAADYARQGYDVLYFSLEMSEDAILNRIDANMLKVPMNNIVSLGKDKFMNRMNYLKQKGYRKDKSYSVSNRISTCGTFQSSY